MYKLRTSTIRGLHYTRYIALPKDWLLNQNLDIADNVDLFLNEKGNIEIVPAVNPAKIPAASTATTPARDVTA